MILLYLFILIVSFHSTSQHLWLSYFRFVPLHYLFIPFSHFTPSHNAFLNDRFILLTSLTSHITRVSLFYAISARPQSSRSTYSIRLQTNLSFLLQNRNIRPSSPLLSLDPSTFRSKIVSVLTTPPLPPPLLAR